MKRTKILAAVSACLFICFPALELLLNDTDVLGSVSYRIWLMFLYIPGAIGILLGTYYLGKVKIYKVPFIFMFLFGIWCIVCTAQSETVTLSLFGFVPMSDSASVYLAYFGMILLGLIIGSDKKYALAVGKVFMAMTLFISILSIIDSPKFFNMFTNEATNCFHYQGVYFNTNQMGYHLSVALIINAYFLEHSKNKIEKIVYLAAFAILTNMLILNNTMGAYLAVTLTLIFAVIWSFINREENKKLPLLALGAFVLISAISCLYCENVINNFVSMFGDVGTLIEDDSTDTEIGAVGSSRGKLWITAWKFIKVSPFFGFGLQGVGFSSHNMFLQIGMYTGIPGLALYLAILLSGVVKLIIMRKTITPITKACAFTV
ncbi:MAG: O-antigen ligase family protein, partial [Clostridia bacterium]|nr:O-antigen ligase family protein [Clostridia bacterium]